MKKVIIILFFFIIIGYYLYGEIDLETRVQHLKGVLWRMDVIFTLKGDQFSRESIWVDNIPSSSEYEILKQSYHEVVSKKEDGILIQKIFSFYLKPLKYGKIKVKSIEFKNGDNSRHFLTTPISFFHKKSFPWKKYLFFALLLVLLVIIAIFFKRKWQTTKSKIDNEEKIPSEDENFPNWIEQKVSLLEQLLESRKFDLLYDELQDFSQRLDREDLKNRVNLYLKNHLLKAKYGNMELSEEEYEELRNLLQKLKADMKKADYLCPICQGSVSPGDTVCPHCGTEFEAENLN